MESAHSHLPFSDYDINIESDDDVSSEDDMPCRIDSDLNVDEDKKQDFGIKKLSFIQILRHFAVFTGQKQDDLTYLLQLLKENEPVRN